MRASSAAIGLSCVTACVRVPSGEVDARQSVYFRADDDATTIVSPRTQITARVGDSLGIDATYAVDVWTGASVDIVTAATKAVSEARHEITAGAAFALGNTSVSGNYRHSTEPDYESHGGVLRASVDLFGKSTTLALTLFGGRDTVGRAGDPWFEELQWSLGARAAWTQILSRWSIVELSWETTTVQGFQSSPYRWVAIGGDGTCAGGAPYCVPERVPGERHRHAATALARLAAPGGVSVGAKYRFYVDSWGIQSHAVEPDVAIEIGRGATLSLDYRYSAQGEASFYRPRYFTLQGAEHVTRDRKLSALHTHSLGAGYVQSFACGAVTCLLGLRAAGTYFTYLAFVGLEHVRAVEVTALLGMTLDVPRLWPATPGGRGSAPRD